MYLHNDKELFNDIVALTAERIGVNFLEKVP